VNVQVELDKQKALRKKLEHGGKKQSIVPNEAQTGHMGAELAQSVTMQMQSYPYIYLGV
jgi:hypothetical protein